MNYPKFAVGEDVVVHCIMLPELNGSEVTIANKTYFYQDEELPEGWYYGISPDLTNDGCQWHESALRKRPSDMSFDELMESLKKPICV